MTRLPELLQNPPDIPNIAIIGDTEAMRAFQYSGDDPSAVADYVYKPDLTGERALAFACLEQAVHDLSSPILTSRFEFGKQAAFYLNTWHWFFGIPRKEDLASGYTLDYVCDVLYLSIDRIREHTRTQIDRKALRQLLVRVVDELPRWFKTDMTFELHVLFGESWRDLQIRPTKQQAALRLVS